MKIPGPRRGGRPFASASAPAGLEAVVALTDDGVVVKVEVTPASIFAVAFVPIAKA